MKKPGSPAEHLNRAALGAEANGGSDGKWRRVAAAEGARGGGGSGLEGRGERREGNILAFWVVDESSLYWIKLQPSESIRRRMLLQRLWCFYH